MKFRSAVAALLLVTAVFAQTEPQELTSDPSDAVSSDVKDRFVEEYRNLVQSVIKANLQKHSAADPTFWLNARAFVFGEKPPPANVDAARQILASPTLRAASVPAGVNSAFPYFRANTPQGEQMKQRLAAAIERANAKPKLTPRDIADVMDAAAPFLRTLEAAGERKANGIVVPPHTKVRLTGRGYCLQHDAGGPGTGPVLIYPSTVLIPDEAKPVFEALLRYSPSHPKAANTIQSLLWAIRHANERRAPSALDPEQRKVLDDAVPHGADAFAEFLDAVQHPERAAKRAEHQETPELLSIDRLRAELARHHLEVVAPIDHGAANPFNPADVPTILRQIMAASTALRFEEQPKSVTVGRGEKAAFRAKVTGEQLTYEWKHEGEAIDGATDTVYEIAHVSARDAGKYVLEVHAGSQTATSAEATLTIDAQVPPQRRRLPADDDPFNSGAASDDPFHQDCFQTLTNEVPPATPAPARPSTSVGHGSAKAPPPARMPTSPTPGIALDADQSGLRRVSVTVANDNDQPYTFNPADFIVSFPYPCQPSPLVPMRYSLGEVTEQDEREAAEALNGAFRQFFLEAPKRADWLSDVPGMTGFTSTVLAQLVREVPFVGSGIAIYEMMTGRNLFTGEELKGVDYVLGSLALVPVVGEWARDIGIGARWTQRAARESELLNSVWGGGRILRPPSLQQLEAIEHWNECTEEITKIVSTAIERGEIAQEVVMQEWDEALDHGTEQATHQAVERVKKALRRVLAQSRNGGG